MTAIMVIAAYDSHGDDPFPSQSQESQDAHNLKLFVTIIIVRAAITVQDTRLSDGSLSLSLSSTLLFSLPFILFCVCRAAYSTTCMSVSNTTSKEAREGKKRKETHPHPALSLCSCSPIRPDTVQEHSVPGVPITRMYRVEEDSWTSPVAPFRWVVIAASQIQTRVKCSNPTREPLRGRRGGGGRKGRGRAAQGIWGNASAKPTQARQAQIYTKLLLTVLVSPYSVRKTYLHYDYLRTQVLTWVLE